MSRTNKSVEIAERVVEGMKIGDMDANRTFHRLFKQCIEGPLEATAADERERERAIAMVLLIITLLLPVPARMDFMAAAEEEDDDVWVSVREGGVITRSRLFSEKLLPGLDHDVVHAIGPTLIFGQRWRARQHLWQFLLARENLPARRHASCLDDRACGSATHVFHNLAPSSACAGHAGRKRCADHGY